MLVNKIFLFSFSPSWKGKLFFLPPSLLKDWEEEGEIGFFPFGGFSFPSK